MNFNKLKLLVPHAIVVLLFVIISFLYFSPLLEGKRLGSQHDVKMAAGMSKEISDYRAQTGKEPLWTNSMFGGMPAYQISVAYKNNVAHFINDNIISLQLPLPARFLFFSLLGFYILLLVFKLDVWTSFAGALAFGFSSYFFIIEAAGHNSKAHAMSLMAPVIAGILLTYRGKYLLGGALSLLFLALQLNANHLQITYYTFLIILVLGIVELIFAIKDHKVNNFLKATSVLAVAAIISVGVNFTNLYLTSEYGKYSTRGKSDLKTTVSNKEDQTSGLDRSYILNDYSYGISETFDLFIPNFLGGASSGELSTNSETYKFLSAQYPNEAGNYIKQMPLYWGDQRFTSGPVYIGAVVIFLFVLGLFVVKGVIKWWLVAATVLSILLAWGRNFAFFSNFFIDHFPGYNKFRTVSMILVIAEFTIPLLGILGLWQMFNGTLKPEEKMKALRNSLFIAGGFALLFTLLPGMFFNFESSSDSQMGFPKEMLSALQDDRKSLLQTDAFRSLVFVLLSAGTLWAFLKNKLAARYASIIFAVLIIADLGFVGKRYLNDKNFSTEEQVKHNFEPNKADEYILQDKSLDYRVVFLPNPFNDATESYFHKSIGGYHGAKLKRYQELIDFQLGGEVQEMTSAFNNKPTPERLDSIMARLKVMNMLNTKYLIYHPDYPPLVNSHVLGNAWYVKSYKWVKDADEEMAALKESEPAKEAVVDERFKNILDNKVIQPDTLATIKLTEYQPNRLVYKARTSTEQLAVFSEIYYDKGWNAYVDGKLTPYFRTDYVLRAMLVPAGEHTIEFRFEPKEYTTGEHISLASSVLLIIIVFGALGMEGYKAMKG